MKTIAINPYLSRESCYELLGRCDTIEKCNIAKAWFEANKVISEDDYDGLMHGIAMTIREIYHGHFDGYDPTIED